MPLSRSVWTLARAFLDDGDELRYLVPATSVFVGGAPGTASFLVAVTDRHVLVLACGYWRRNRPESVWVRLPRSTRLGPVDTATTASFTVGDLVLETEDEYVAVLLAADAEAAGDAMPPDPLPDL
jgi:hypothetical protein